MITNSGKEWCVCLIHSIGKRVEWVMCAVEVIQCKFDLDGLGVFDYFGHKSVYFI